jgi:hypothetical protein
MKGRLSRHSLINGSLVLALLVTSNVAFAHPSEGYEPNELHPNYGDPALGLPSEANFAEIDFTAEYPDPGSLTAAERYMIAGTKTSSFGPGLQPWYQTIMSAVRVYYKNHQEVPDELTLQDIREMTSGQPDSDWEEIYKSPITGEFPRLKELENSPGNLYVRVLTSEEVDHLSKFWPGLRKLYFESISINPHSGEATKIELTSPIFFVRVHGYEGAIWESLSYSTRAPIPN